MIGRYGLAKPLSTPKVQNNSSFIVGAADHRQIAREIEKKAAEYGPSDTNDNAPFNFQARSAPRNKAIGS